ncbi:MAG: succinate dehydrogenase assembly factor 2 [Gammaproteobacteria bacterium]|nr:MAG: succinate dehydrogenase assembly factor 2 [Gammaproteobacteria bacterium]
MSELSKLRWRCRRGAKELDVMFERYLEKGYDQSSEADRQAFDKLLEIQDPKLLRYMLSQEAPDSQELLDIVSKIQSIPPN